MATPIKEATEMVPSKNTGGVNGVKKKPQKASA
jgi:hypothetical protein